MTGDSEGTDDADGGDDAVSDDPNADPNADTFQPPVENRGRAIAVVFAVVFVDLLGFGILVPVIPLYAEGFGASEFVVGLLVASYSLAQFVAAPVLGRLSDERGRRPVLLVSLLGSVLAWTAFGLAGALWVLFAARILAGLMGGNIAAAQAYVADVTPPSERAGGLGLVGAAFGLGFVFGPALGGVFSSAPVVATVDGALPAVVRITEFTLPSFVAAAITAVNLVVAAVVLPETNPPDSDSTDVSTVAPDDGPGRIQRLREAFADPALSGLIAAFFLLSLAFSGMESMFVLFTGDQYGFGPAANGYVLAYVGVVVAVVQGGLVGRLAKRYGEHRLAVVGVAVEAAALVALPFSPALGGRLPAVGPLVGALPTLSGPVQVLLVVMGGLAVGNALANVSLTTLVSKHAGSDDQGGAFGLTRSAGAIARAAGPVAAGALYTAVDFRLPFVAGGVVVAGVLYVLATSVREPAEDTVVG